MAYSILIDTNVLLDFVLEREPYYEAAKTIIESCAKRESLGFMAAHSVPNMFYIMRKDYTISERRKILLRLISLVDVVGIDSYKIENALKNEDFSDYEDCLQAECACDCFADYIITRNIKDYPQPKVKAITPEQYLHILKELQ